MEKSDCILIVDDDPEIRRLLVDYLARNGFAAIAARDGREMWQALDRHLIDLVVLDLMLPDSDGLTLCRDLRAKSNIPVLMLTARGEEADRIVGIEMGADDYLVKPFNPRELLARLRALLRRSQMGAAASAGDVLQFGALELDRGALEVRLNGLPVALTAHQFSLLWALATHPGRVLSREALLELARGDALESFDRSIDVHISRIRAAIEDDPREPRRIITVRGAGYVFAQRQDEDVPI
jgi:two-component system OmpR family response regulator